MSHAAAGYNGGDLNKSIRKTWALIETANVASPVMTADRNLEFGSEKKDPVQRRNNDKRVSVRFIAILVLVLAPSIAGAHALGAEAKLRGQRVEVEAYFSDNTPAQDAHVLVHDVADQTIAEGRTDERGQWSFPVPPSGQYTVIVNAGAGHRKEITVTIPKKASEGEMVSDGPLCAEFTSFPWGKTALGLAIIAALAVGWPAVRRRIWSKLSTQNE